MGFDWLFSNWELYIGLAVALAITVFIYLKQEIEALSGTSEKAVPETGNKDQIKKNKSSKESAVNKKD